MRMVDICIREMGRMAAAPKKMPTLIEAYNDVLMVFNITEKEFKSKCRDRDLTIPRQIFCYVAYTYCGIKLEAILSYIGRKDHTTVVHARDTAMKHISSRDVVFYTFWNKYKKQSDVWIKIIESQPY